MRAALRTGRFPSEIREALIRRRRELALSQQFIADLMLMSSGMLSMLESGQRDPSWKTLAKWCDALDMAITFDVEER